MLQLHPILLLKWQLKQPLDVIPKALVDKHVHKRVDAGIEGDNDDANDVGDVSVLLTLKIIIKHIDDQHWKPSDTVHSADLKPNEYIHLYCVLCHNRPSES